MPTKVIIELKTQGYTKRLKKTKYEVSPLLSVNELKEEIK